MVLCLAAMGCSQRSEVQDDIPGRLHALAARATHPVYFLGESYQGKNLTEVDNDGTFVYGTCESEWGDEGPCTPPTQVQNGVAFLPAATRGCARVRDVRGVPAASFGGGLAVFTGNLMVQIFGDETEDEGDLRKMGDALRPIPRPAGSTRPLPGPTNSILRDINKRCGAKPGGHGPTIEK